MRKHIRDLNSNCKLIIVDDSRVELGLCKEAIKIAHLENPVITLNSANDAYEYVKKNAQDLCIIFLDMDMPGMSGLDFLEKINADSDLRLQSIPIVVFSNHVEIKTIRKAYQLSCAGYFRKPLYLEEFAEIFKSIVNYWALALVPKILENELSLGF